MGRPHGVHHPYVFPLVGDCSCCANVIKEGLPLGPTRFLTRGTDVSLCGVQYDAGSERSCCMVSVLCFVRFDVCCTVCRQTVVFSLYQATI